MDPQTLNELFTVGGAIIGTGIGYHIFGKDMFDQSTARRRADAMRKLYIGAAGIVVEIYNHYQAGVRSVDDTPRHRMNPLGLGY
ncbi:MAG TPA: hypothetical protein VJI12_01690 [archaeon]|nr:hypothetical protein [archaeon]